MTTEKFYAGFWVRLFAGLLDMAFLTPLIVILVYFSGAHHSEIIRVGNDFRSYSFASEISNISLTDFITYGASLAYIGYFLASKKQATFGKRLMGIYVGNRDGSKLSPAKAIARAAASMLTAATLGLGFIIVIFTKEKISLHDFICGTRVFHGKKNGN